MGIISGWLVPHPPLIFPEVGRGREHEISNTIEAFRTAAAEIAAAAPDTVVIVSPHSKTYSDYFHVLPGEGAAGDMKSFGISGVKIEAAFDNEFADALSLECAADGFPAGTLGERVDGLDHGISIPVRFINEAVQALGTGIGPKYVCAGIAGLPFSEHYIFGQMIAKTAERLGRKTVVVASGDLSHRLLDVGPYGYTKEGPEYDKIICDTSKDGDFSRLFSMEDGFLEKAGECGQRPLIVMAGALDRKAVEAKLLSYEGPFGVGYGVASFTVAGADEGRAFLRDYLDHELELADERHKSESPHVALARQTVENYVKTGRLYKNPEPFAEELAEQKAGVFVTIKKEGQLRGCIGTITPVTDCIGEEVRSNAVSASIRDPRFEAISEDELPYLEYSVDVLAPAEVIESEDELDTERYGVIVSLGGRRGLLLPNLEGIDDACTQVGIAMRKAGIAESDRSRIKLERFEVIRHT